MNTIPKFSSRSKQQPKFYSKLIVNKPLRVTIFGPPGGGKGTQCAKLQKDYGCLVLTTGDELRKLARTETELGKKIQNKISKGEMVDDQLLINIMDTLVIKPKHDSFVVDGFPRSISQAVEFDKLLENHGVPLTLAIMLDVPHDVIVERVSGRRVHTSSGRVYNISYNPPKVEGKDDVTGEPLVQREDDIEATVRSRLDTYQKNTLPLLEYYKKKGILVTIPSPTSDEGYIHIKALFDKFYGNTM